MNWIPVCVLLIATLAAGEPPALEDTILLHNGHHLSGTVLTRLEPATVTVRIQTATGTLELPRDLIDTITLGYATRRRQLDQTSGAEHLALAQWCLNQGMKREALELVRIALSLGSETDPAAVGLEALLIDEVEHSPERALPRYRRYRELGGTEQRILDRLAEVEAAEVAYQQAVQEAMAKAATTQTEEGMETGPWLSESPLWYNPLDKELIDVNGGADNLVKNQALHLTLKPSTADKKADIDKAAIRNRLALDATAHRQFTCFVLNPGKLPLPVSIAIKTGEKWEYFESRTQVAPGNNQWTRISFDLMAKDFKCLESEWIHNHPISHPEDIREIQIQFHNYQREAEVFLDGIGFSD
jgi:hypothetical protein